MNYRRLGRTPLTLSEIGFGAWGIGGAVEGSASYGHTSDQESMRAIERSLDLGVNFFDTAPAYGNGKSESLLGSTLASRRENVVIATKVGVNKFGDPVDFSDRGIQSSVEGSLDRLRTDYIDLIQIHSPDMKAVDISSALNKLHRLKEQGTVRAIGVSVKSPADMEALIGSSLIDSFQVNFNILDQRILESTLISRAAEAGKGIIARTPLCFGFLTDEMTSETIFPVEDHRSAWSGAQRSLWLEGRDITKAEVSEAEQESVEMTSLRFCLSFEEVVSVIPGILTEAHASRNLAASDKGPLSQQQIAFLRNLYNTKKFFI